MHACIRHIAALGALSASLGVASQTFVGAFDVGPGGNPQKFNPLVASAGFGKWLLLFVATLILSLLFLRRDWLGLLGVLYLLIGIIGIYGLVRNHPRLVELSFGLYFVGVVAVAIVFTFYPRKILEHL